jgi:hypothetical protein
LIRPIAAHSRPIRIQWPESIAALLLWAVGRVEAGRQSERQRLSAAQGVARTGGLWAASCDRKECFFSVLIFQRTVLIVSCSNFEQFSYSFYYSKFSNKILTRDCKKLQKLFYKV